MKNKHKNGFSGRLAAAYQAKLDICLQMCMDAALIAADDVFGLSPEQATEYCNAYKSTLNEIAKLLAEDDDKELVYSTVMVDRRLKQIVGEENFADWNRRYG